MTVLQDAYTRKISYVAHSSDNYAANICADGINPPFFFISPSFSSPLSGDSPKFFKNNYSLTPDWSIHSAYQAIVLQENNVAYTAWMGRSDLRMIFYADDIVVLDNYTSIFSVAHSSQPC